MSKKRGIEAFFASSNTQQSPEAKRSRQLDNSGENLAEDPVIKTFHQHYPFPIAELPSAIASDVPSLPAREGRIINDQPHLDLLYFEPFIPDYLAKHLFNFLRANLPFYRVEYDINRGGVSTHIRTPRWTTVFGLDDTSKFDKEGIPIDAKTSQRVKDKNYDKFPPRPIPQCLDELRKATEVATDCKFNFCLVNYYASGADSISFHSDDERFLGPNPDIASFSLGAPRDFLMKHKQAPPSKPGEPPPPIIEAKTLKLRLGSGDMILMRGETQGCWLHSIPKRTGRNANDGGRINITFRRAMVKGGTENYYNYNVGKGPVYRWDPRNREMILWKP